MGLDIRKPIGLLLLIVGLQLSAYGLMSDQAIYRKSLNVNVNLAWGSVLLVCGAVMLFSSLRRKGAG